MAVGEILLTAEEFGNMPDDGRYTELVRGRIVEVTQPGWNHGFIASEVSGILRDWVRLHDLGRVVSNDSGIVTQRDPDTVRGADVAYYSYARLPKKIRPHLYPEIPPDIVVEVRSPSDRWPKILEKVQEYLDLGVLVVCVLDPEPQAARLYRPGQPELILGPDDELTFPECLPEFRVPVRRFFE